MDTISNFDTLIEQQRMPEIASLVQLGLMLEDAEDVFQEASLALYNTLSEQSLELQSTPEAYLHGICRNLGHKKLEERKRTLNNIDEDRLDRLLELTQEPVEEEPSEWNYLSVLNRLLGELNPRDYGIIWDFYIEGMNMSQVAQIHSLANEEVARTTKSRIISKMRERALVMINGYF